jgi:hypothetical protein
MFKIILIGITVIIAAVLIFAATRPDTFRVQRSVQIKATPERIFPLINDLHGMNSWSPYVKKDPAMQGHYAGATSGKGAIYEWDGNKEAGKGNIEIVASTFPTDVKLKLNMIKPFAAHNDVEFTLEPGGESTTVTWAMSGHAPFMAKLIHLFFNMDKMVGGDFEKGLAALKSLLESSTTQDR